MVRQSSSGVPTCPAEPAAETAHLAPWDLQMLTVDYIQKGILLPKPPAGDGGERLVGRLASSFARALGRFYPFAGRLAAEEQLEDGSRAASPSLCAAPARAQSSSTRWRPASQWPMSRRRCTSPVWSGPFSHSTGWSARMPWPDRAPSLPRRSPSSRTASLSPCCSATPLPMGLPSGTSSTPGPR
uniref:Uncharacterized protein n=1 Tax=Triticum urartu TaxID=4572 RepID=A0A8R7R241_TRIUA